MAAATAVGVARQGIDNNPIQAVNDCRYYQVCTDAFSLGFHKGLFLFAKTPDAPPVADAARAFRGSAAIDAPEQGAGMAMARRWAKK